MEPELIPPPSVVRDRLARNLQEAAWLRSLLRLSIRVAEDRREQKARDAQRQEAAACHA